MTRRTPRVSLSAGLVASHPATRRVAGRLARLLEQLGAREEAARIRSATVPDDR